MIKKITSKDNPFFKQLKKLYTDGAYRRETGLFVVEGEKLVFELLDINWPLKYLTISESFLENKPFLAKYQNLVVLPDNLLKGVSDLVTPPGILVVAQFKTVPFPWEEDGAFLILDGVQDPGNAGNLLRAALGFGVRGAILVPPAVDVFSPKVIRASAGASLKLPVLRMSQDSLIDVLQKNNYPLVLAEASGGTAIFEYTFLPKFFLAIGSEGRGISDDLKALFHHKVYIPMPGAVESLNAALAGGIIMYEWAKNRANL